uniref:Uncharacterized protein n=1 Tax=Rhizophora mucronata TaxID=61149 RepID=A0A2P2PSS6_RHIMU
MIKWLVMHQVNKCCDFVITNSVCFTIRCSYKGGLRALKSKGSITSQLLRLSL